MELELLRQCVDRALVLDHRVSKFCVQLGEWPGDMAKLLDVLSREDVRWGQQTSTDLQIFIFDSLHGFNLWLLHVINSRLLDVSHRRHSDKSELFKAKVKGSS